MFCRKIENEDLGISDNLHDIGLNPIHSLTLSRYSILRTMYKRRVLLQFSCLSSAANSLSKLYLCWWSSQATTTDSWFHFESVESILGDFYRGIAHTPTKARLYIIHCICLLLILHTVLCGDAVICRLTRQATWVRTFFKPTTHISVQRWSLRPQNNMLIPKTN